MKMPELEHLSVVREVEKEFRWTRERIERVYRFVDRNLGLSVAANGAKASVAEFRVPQFLWSIAMTLPAIVLATRFWGNGYLTVGFTTVATLTLICAFIWSLRAIPERFQTFGWKGNLARLSPIAILLAFICSLPIEHRGKWTDPAAATGNMIIGIVVGLCLLCSFVWQLQFMEDYHPYSLELKRTTRRKLQLLDEAMVWQSSYSGLEAESKARDRADFVFTVLAAFILNAFTLLGSLQNPILFLCFYLLGVGWLLHLWSRRLGDWRKEASVLSANWGELLYPLMIFFVGFVLFLWNSALATAEYQNWVSAMVERLEQQRMLGPYPVIGSAEPNELEWADIRPSSIDNKVFSGQLVCLLTTIAIPYLTKRVYSRTIRSHMSSTGYELRNRHGAFLRVNQRSGEISAVGCEPPLFGRSVHSRILDGDAMPVYWRARWYCRGWGERREYRYGYSVFVVGREFFIDGLEGNCLRRSFVILREWLAGKAPAKSGAVCPYYVRRLSGTDDFFEPEGGGINLGSSKATPFVPDDLLTG
ncbi:hypothetical protein [Corynebacterium afermentans]|nr:hypothetical protein [Corynebacterium afermentans]